jgi:hypothetical protein
MIIAITLTSILLGLSWLIGGNSLIVYLMTRYQMQLRRKQLREFGLTKSQPIPVKYSRTSYFGGHTNDTGAQKLDMYVSKDFVMLAPLGKFTLSFITETRMPIVFSFHPERVKKLTTVNNVWRIDQLELQTESSFVLMIAEGKNAKSMFDIQILQPHDFNVMEKIRNLMAGSKQTD